MGVITGVGAAVDGLPCLRQFKIVTRGIDNKVACSASAGAVVRSTPNKDWMGVAVGFGHTPAKLPGELFQLTGNDSGGEGWQSAANGAIVDRVQVVCPTKDGKDIFHYIYFSANGALTAGTYNAADATIPAPANASERGVTIGSTVIPDVGMWAFDIFGNTAEPIWTSSSGGWPNRKPGNIDAEITFSQYFNAHGDLPVLGDHAIYKLHVTAALYWEISWGQLLEQPAEYTVSDESGKPEYVVSEQKAHFSGSYGGARGYIKTPGGTTYWP